MDKAATEHFTSQETIHIGLQYMVQNYIYVPLVNY